MGTVNNYSSLASNETHYSLWKIEENLASV